MDKTSEKERMNEIAEATMKVARGDYSVQVELSGKSDEFDSLAMGLNMMVDDIRTKEETLRESEERYRALLELGGEVGEAVVMLQDTEQGDGIQTFVSDEWPRITGYSRRELLGMPFFDLVHPKHREASLERHRRKMRGEAMPGLFELSIIRKDGTEVPIELTSAYTTYRGERANVAYIRDITERKRMEEALRESERSLAQLYDEAPVGYHELDREGRITRVNRTELDVLGYTAEEMLGQHVWGFIVEDETASQAFASKIAGTMPLGQAFERTYRRKDGSTISTLIEDRYVKDQSGQVIGLRSTIQDITERKRMERELQERNEQLDAQNEELQSQAEELMTQQQELIKKTAEVERANQLKSEFLASMSHELRTPLNVIIGFSQLMRDEVSGKVNDEQRQCLDDILAGGQHLLNLINDILDLSKVEAGKMEFKLESLNLADVINDAAQTIKLMLDDKGHKLRVSVEEGLPQVRADRGRLKQVFLNLLSNATKFTLPGGKLGIEVSRQGNWCQISVVDNSIGIKEEDREKIFEVFTQAEALPDGNKRGTGLGLALTRQFVEVMGGRIWVESEYGKGSRFTFTLPMAGEDEPYLEEKREELEVRLPEVKEPPTKPGQKRVLVVDDDHRTRRLVSALLKAEGCAVAEASTGDEGIKKAKELVPALVILDILMPGKDGWQVLQALKSMPETRDIPVVITSVIEEKEPGFRLGAVDYFVKPIDRKRFQKRIAELGIARREKVLVVDDNPADVRLVASILEAENIEALCAYGGEEGVRMAKENEPSLIVLDILMTDLDGFEVIERLRQDEKTRNIPIIILTMKELTKEELRMLWQTKAIIMKATFSREDFVSEVKRVVNLGGE